MNAMRKKDSRCRLFVNATYNIIEYLYLSKFNRKLFYIRMLFIKNTSWNWWYTNTLGYCYQIFLFSIAIQVARRDRFPKRWINKNCIRSKLFMMNCWLYTYPHSNDEYLFSLLIRIDGVLVSYLFFYGLNKTLNWLSKDWLNCT